MNVVIYPYSIEHRYIKNAIIDILNDAKCGKINIEEINENTIKNYLDTILSVLCVMVIFYR